jgi:tight adherence protein B
MIIFVLFAILLMAACGIAAYAMQPSAIEKRGHERLDELSRPIHQELEEDIIRDVKFSSIEAVDRFLRTNAAALKLHLMLEQAKVDITVGKFATYTFVLLVMGGLAGKWWMPNGLTGGLAGMLLGGLPLIWVLYNRSARLRRLNKQLPEAVDLITRGLRAGYALPSSFIMVADEIGDPLGPEFRRIGDELNFGLPFREALLNLQKRYPMEDLQFLITAILVQKETGGNLIELLEKISALLRARIQLRDKVRVYTAQGRATGAILCAMPFVCFVLLNFVKHDYSQAMFDSELGQDMLKGAAFAMVLGILAIRRIVNIQV